MSFVAQIVGVVYAICFALAFPAFLGVAFYTLIGGFYLFQAAPFGQQTRQEIFSHIPLLVRRIGYISILTFAGCVVLGMLAAFLHTRFR